MTRLDELHPPYAQPLWGPADAAALQAMQRGEATPEQQTRALNWIRISAAATDDLEYRTDGRDHAFASGRRFVGLQINRMLHVNISEAIDRMAQAQIALDKPRRRER